MRGRLAATNPFVLRHRASFAWAVCKLMHTKQILTHFYVVARSACSRSAHNVTLKHKFTCPCFMKHKSKAAEFYAT